MVLKNVENKIKLVTIVCSIFLVGCVVISLGSIFTARNMVADAHKQIYVLDSNVPILVKISTCSITCSSPLHLMTNTSSTLLTRPCTLSMKQVWLSTMP